MFSVFLRRQIRIIKICNMRTAIKSFTFLFALLAFCTNAAAWGQKGHDVTCCVAERHLSKKAQKQVAAVLDGKSIVYWANWMDNASHTKEYAYTSTWHYKNINADETFENAQINEKGDVVTAINAQIAALKSHQLNKEAEALALKMLVHLMGDLHCPMHMAHRSDRGGNKIQVNFFGNGSNLHSIWDSGVINRAHAWTYSEWADQIDTVTKAEAAEIVKGSVEDWGKETFATTAGIYEATPKGSKLSYDYVSDWTPTIEHQLLLGGYRLAKVLNEIYK